MQLKEAKTDDERSYLRKEKEQLRTKEEQLRKEKERVRDDMSHARSLKPSLEPLIGTTDTLCVYTPFPSSYAPAIDFPHRLCVVHGTLPSFTLMAAPHLN